ncbi:unnamed protein product [Rotaria sordida]|uniref:Uncharacterized protein n=1 Tax=Rotaria sordida TaxID=392033 RepID=A0A819BEF7_9BILA|nr:unnamed protein product [Rotaria sordida]CAF3790904.1 unnamed protein product [Rotaria sordida]CAF3890533.1 unnamed protein product [Rotaria sordida]
MSLSFYALKSVFRILVCNRFTNLEVKAKKTTYEAKILIRNGTSKQWSHGMIIPQYQLFYTNYSIEWNGYHLSMISKLASWTTDILDQSQGNLLAQIQRRWLSWELNYRLDIFSDSSINT